MAKVTMTDNFGREIVRRVYGDMASYRVTTADGQSIEMTYYLGKNAPDGPPSEPFKYADQQALNTANITPPIQPVVPGAARALRLALDEQRKNNG